MSEKLIKQTKNAFEFVQKLYTEISYLIKEVEGQLHEEEERFVIGRPSGYGVTTRTSVGLEPAGVQYWLPRTFTVFFCPEDRTREVKGQTVTDFGDDLRLPILDIEVTGPKLAQPRVLSGCIWDIVPRKEKYKKFENLMVGFAYHHHTIFANLPDVSYSDSNRTFKGRFKKENLFAIKHSEDIQSRLIQPMLKLYRSV